MKFELNVLKPLGYGLTNHKRRTFMKEKFQVVYSYKYGTQMTTSGRNKAEPIVCVNVNLRYRWSIYLYIYCSTWWYILWWWILLLCKEDILYYFPYFRIFWCAFYCDKIAAGITEYQLLYVNLGKLIKLIRCLMGWIGSPRIHLFKVLTHSSSDCDCFGDRVFKEGIKLK